MGSVLDAVSAWLVQNYSVVVAIVLVLIAVVLIGGASGASEPLSRALALIVGRGGGEIAASRALDPSPVRGET